MKFTGIPIALATVLTGGLLTVGPMTSRAADHAPDCQRERTAEFAPGQTHPPDGEATTGSLRLEKSGVEMHGKEGDEHQACEQGDLSGALLEDLVKQDRSRPEAGP